MQDLQLNPEQPTYTAPDEVTDKGAKTPKKRSGCGCFLIGCLTLILIILVPSGIGFYYIASMDEADYGGLAVKLITMPELAEGIRKGIEDNNDMSTEDKKAFLEAYDKLLANYGNLSETDKASVDRNVGRIIRKAFTDPESLENTPPPEVMELLKILGFGDTGFIPRGASLDNPQVQPQTPLTAVTPPSTGDPYDFNLPTEPDQGTQLRQPASNYDF